MIDEREFGLDLDLGLRADDAGNIFAGPHSVGDLQGARRANVAPRAVDIVAVGGRRNLMQALVLRLMTERGELAPLGLPEYGSRHHQLIGEPNTESNRARLKLYVLECLRQEPRVSSVTRVIVHAVSPGAREMVTIELTVIPIGDTHPLNLVVPFAFATGGSTGGRA
jgi:phage baseplate assembly protein W